MTELDFLNSCSQCFLAFVCRCMASTVSGMVNVETPL